MKRHFIFLILWTLPLFSQTYKQKVKGKVIDIATERPLPGAKVSLITRDSVYITLSNGQGEFVFPEVPVGKVKVVAEFVGYNPVVLENITVISGKEVYLVLKLEESTVKLQEVEIVAEEDKSKPQNDFALISTKRITMEASKRYAGAYGDPARMALTLAGVNSPADTRNDIIVRGNSPLGVLWRFEGFNIPSPNHFSTLGTTGGAINLLNANLLGDADFFLSAWTPEYGNALAGVFDIKMRQGNKDKYEFLGQIGFSGFELDAEGPLPGLKNASFLVSYRYSTLDLFQKLKLPLNIGATPQYQDLNFKADIPVGEGFNKISFFAIGGISHIDVLEENRGENTMTYTAFPANIYYGSLMGATGTKFSHFFNEKTRGEIGISASLAGSSVQVDSVLADNSTKKFYENDSREQRIEVVYHLSKKINGKNHIKTGAFVDFITYNYQDSVRNDYGTFNPLSSFDGNAELLQYYFSWKHKFSEKFEIVSGIYSAFFTFNNTYSVDPRFSLRWKMHPKHSFSVGVGKHSQIQPSTLYFTYADTTEKVQTNKDLEFSQSLHSVLGYTFRISNRLLFSVEGYYQYLYNIPVKETPSAYSALNEGATFVQPFQDSLVNEGLGYNYGIDLTFEHLLYEGFYFITAVSFYESKYKGSDGIWRNTAFNGNYSMKIVGGKEFVLQKQKQNRLLVDFKIIYAGNRRYVPIDEEKSKLLNREVYDYSRSYEERYPDYFRADLRVAYKKNFKRISQEWAINIQNVTNRLNVFQYQYSPYKGEIITQYQSGILPIGEWRIYF